MSSRQLAGNKISLSGVVKEMSYLKSLYNKFAACRNILWRVVLYSWSDLKKHLRVFNEVCIIFLHNYRWCICTCFFCFKEIIYLWVSNNLTITNIDFSLLPSWKANFVTCAMMEGLSLQMIDAATPGWKPDASDHSINLSM